MCTLASAFGRMLLLAAVVVTLLCSVAAEPSYVVSSAAGASTWDSETDVYYLPDEQDYRVRMNMTESGIPCQVWSSQTLHNHQISLDPATEVWHQNYCRNANGLERPGCLATTPNGCYEFCAIGAVYSVGPFSKPTVQFSPVDGTQMTADGSNNYVTLRCHPQPCRIHYVLGVDASASASSPLYAQPLLLEASTTVKTHMIYGEARPIRAQARCTVTTATTAAPTGSIEFTTSDSVVYDYPIFAVLQGITNPSHVRLYWDDDFMNPATYNGGTLRLAKSTKIVAVVNSTYWVAASYRLNITGPPLNVYLPSGTYVGDLTVLVKDPQPPATYYMFVNRSANWVPLSTLLFPWAAIGTSALHLKGIESVQTVVYEVVPTLSPTISPDPSIAHHRPVNVTCTAPPLGTPVALSVYRDAALQDAVVEEVFSVVLSAPGAYTVMCSYADGLQATHTTTAVLQLVSVPMQPPTFIPACGANFPAIALSLQVELNMLNLRPGDVATSWCVSPSATGGACISIIARSSDAVNVFVYDVFRTKSIQMPTTMEVHAMAHSLDPLASDSPRATCAYSLYPLGTSATPYFSAIPDCATGSTPASPLCIMTLKQQLASCLYFRSTELLSLRPFGPILSIRMTGFAAAIQSDMHTRMGACLADMQCRGVLSNVRNEASGEMVLATSWHVATSTPIAAQVYAGLPITVQVMGFHADVGEYHLVRKDHSCEDIGLLPEAAHEASRYATEAAGSPPVQPGTDASTCLTFRVPIAGQYELCSYISDSPYEAPFNSFSGGAATAAASQYLDVVAQPWPALAARPAEECGDFAPSDMEGIAFPLSMAAVPAGAFASLAYPYNSAEWTSVPFPIDVETKLGGAASVSVGPLNRLTRPLEVFDASLGPTAGAAQTRVFFVSATDPSVPRDITYFFYKVNASEVPPDLTGVMLLLQGRFQPGELIVIDVYENVTLTSEVGATSSSLRLLRRVTARASVATAYGVALPDSILGLPADEQERSYLIHATLDGVSLPAAPSMVALSPLALAMSSCTTCPSKLCYKSQCLCKNKYTKAVSICGTDSSDLVDSDGHISDSSASSSFKDGEGGHAKPVSLGERVMFLFAYLALLAVIASYIFVSIKRGGSRRGRGTNAEDIAVHDS